MPKHFVCRNLRRYLVLIVVLASLSFRSAVGQEAVPSPSPSEIETDVPAAVTADAPTAVDADRPAAVEPAADAQKSAGEATESETATNGTGTDVGETQLRFSFSYAPWKDVLDWFATQADCSLLMEAPPHGTFNYTDRRSYTPGEAIDVINSVLLTKGFTLVRRERMLILVNLEDGIPPNLVSQVAAEDLDERGEFELVSSLFPIQRLTPEEAEAEITKLLGPQGKLVVLPKSGQILVTETAGKLRAIRKMISAIETPDKTGGVKITQLPLQHIGPDEAMAVIRQIMGIPEEEFATEDESLRLSIDAVGGRLLVKATPDALAEVTDILNLVDVALDEAPVSGGIETVPQLEVYSISNADPTAVLEVMQTLMAGLPDVRLALDPKTNNLVALARPSQHETIRATLGQMQQEFSQIEVFQLQVLEPETAKLAVQSLFGITGDEEEGQTTGPRVDVNLTTNQLLVRGTSAEIERIKALLQKMGETGDGPGVANLADRGNIRMLPITGASARALLERAQLVWPAIGRNRIQTVTPSAAVDAMGHRSPALPERSPESRSEGIQLPGQSSDEPPAQLPAELRGPKVLDHNHGEAVHAVLSPNTQRVVYLAQATGEIRAAGNRSPVAVADVAPQELPVIVVAPGPGGLLIASEDTEALNQFEQLLETLSDPALSPTSDYTVFYLTYAKADTAASLLRTLVGSGGGSELDSMAGGIFGGLLGGGLGAVTDGLSLGVATQIVPDGRINALFVKAEPEDLDLIRQLLQIIDVEYSPENVQTTSPPRLIPVFNANASEVAEVVKQVYAGRIAKEDDRGGGRQGGNNMEEMMNAMRRARGGGGGQQQGAPQQEEPPMTIGVDARSNSIIVSAPEPLFQEVKALVAQLDDVAIASNEVTRVVTITQSNPESIHKALDSLFGGQVSTRSGQNDRSSSSSSQTPGRQDASSSSMQDQIRRRMEMFNAFQRARGGGGGTPGGGRGGGTPGGGRGGGTPGGGRGGR